MIAGGLDVGTTGCKIALYDEKCELLNTYYREYPAIHKNGRHEIDFSDVKSGVFSILKQAANDYQIDALGVTSFGETFAMLDCNDTVLAPSMLYTDPRGKEECDFLCKTLGETNLTLQTGVKPHPMYSIAKILWLKNHDPQAFRRCDKILLGEDFIVYALTGVRQIDYSLAARTAAFDIEKKCWFDKVFDAAGIDLHLMSTPVPTGTVAGNITDTVKEELGIDYDITVVNGCHDQVAAMIGAGVFAPDQAMDGTGTVECIPVILKEKPTDTRFYEGGYSVVPYLSGQYACYALSFTGGATLKWFRDNFAQRETENAKEANKNVYAELDQEVSGQPTGILVLPHFAGAATPYMDPDAKAAFAGVTLETTKYDLYKALMEGTSYEMLLNFDTMKAMTGEIKEIRATGGGSLSDVWLQIKSGSRNTGITALSCKEVGAAGTAALAGVAVGIFEELKSVISKTAMTRKVFIPDRERHAVYSGLYQKYANLYRAIKEL